MWLIDVVLYDGSSPCRGVYMGWPLGSLGCWGCWVKSQMGLQHNRTKVQDCGDRNRRGTGTSIPPWVLVNTHGGREAERDEVGANILVGDLVGEIMHAS